MKASNAWIVVGIALAFSGPVRAQDSASGYSVILDNIDLLIDNYTRALVAKYSLTPDQTTYTAELIRQNAYSFLDKHEAEVRPVLERMFAVRSGEEISPADLIAWGEAVMPIYAEAREVVVSSNTEWRKILDDKQSEIHDRDVAQMEASFDTIDTQLGRIVAGEMSVDEFRNPRLFQPQPERRPSRAAIRPDRSSDPDPQPDGEHPAAGEPVRSVDGGVVTRRVGESDESGAVADVPQVRITRGDGPSASDGETGNRRRRTEAPTTGWETEWDKYVKGFIEKHQLDQIQQQRAQTILETAKKQAKRVLVGQEAKLADLDKQKGELRKSRDRERTKKIRELDKQREEILAPLTKIFETQVKARLERLPTRAQRKAAEAAAAEPRRDAEREQPSSRPAARRPDSESESPDETGDTPASPEADPENAPQDPPAEDEPVEAPSEPGQDEPQGQPQPEPAMDP